MSQKFNRRRVLAGLGATVGGLPAIGSTAARSEAAAIPQQNSDPAFDKQTTTTEFPVVTASTAPQEGYVFDVNLPDSIRPTIETAQVKTATVTGLSEDIIVTDIETGSGIANDPFADYQVGAEEFQVVFEVEGAHELEVTIEAQEPAAEGIEPYKPNIVDIGVTVEDENGGTAADGVTLGIRDATPTIGSYADGDTGEIGLSRLENAIDDWRGGEIRLSLLRETIGYWRSGEPVSFVDVPDQEIDGTEITVDAATYAGHAWGAHVHFFAGGDMGATVGVSEEFEAGEVAEDFTIPLDGLDEPLEQQQTLMVMLHTTNEAGGYDGNDAVWAWVDENPVTDLTFVEPN